MVRNLLVRLLDTLPTLLLVLTLVFVAMRILPGDPAVAALGDMATPEQLEIFREKLGLNVPIWQQFINFLGGVLTLDFGNSYQLGTPVTQMIAQNLPYTIELTVVAMIMGSVVGIPLGVLAATQRNKAARHRRPRLLADRLRDPRLLSRRAAADHVRAEPAAGSRSTAAAIRTSSIASTTSSCRR